MATRNPLLPSKVMSISFSDRFVHTTITYIINTNNNFHFITLDRCRLCERKYRLLVLACDQPKHFFLFVPNTPFSIWHHMVWRYCYNNSQQSNSNFHCTHINAVVCYSFCRYNHLILLLHKRISKIFASIIKNGAQK